MIANCGELTAGMDFIPEARIDDGELDIVVLSPRNAVGWLRIAAKTLVRHTAPIPVIEYHRGRRSGSSQHEPDGHPAGRRPLGARHVADRGGAARVAGGADPGARCHPADSTRGAAALGRAAAAAGSGLRGIGVLTCRRRRR